MLHAFCHNMYFRQALCLVMDELADVPVLNTGWMYIGVDLIDTDVALRRAGGLFDDEVLSVREQERLDEITAIDFESKIVIASWFERLGFKIRLDPIGEMEFPFSVLYCFAFTMISHRDFNCMWERLQMLHSLQYSPTSLYIKYDLRLS